MKTFHIKDFGAAGDGKTVCTESIQKAIDECAKTGGTVLIEGGTFVTGTLFMRSNTELHIAANASLKASENGDDFPDFDCPQWNVKAAPRSSARCLIYFGYIENASITGFGTIDCSGGNYCSPVKDENGKIIKYERNTLNLPARMVFIMGCRNIAIENVTMKEMAGGWGYWINNSEFVTVSKAKLICNPKYPNADGIHINCSSDVLVEGCFIHSGDDSIIIRANTNTLKEKRPCERVVVKGCTLSSNCQAVRIGWRNDGEIKNCTLSDLVITNSMIGIVAEMPDHSSPTDIGENKTVIKNITVNNVVFDDIQYAPIRVIIHPENMVGEISNLRFSNIISESGDYPEVWGREDAILNEIYFSDCKFTVCNTDGFSKSPRFFNYVKGLHMTNTTFDIGTKSICHKEFGAN